ncbi:MAG: hypothetical protein ABH870_04260 [bacterium]
MRSRSEKKEGSGKKDQYQTLNVEFNNSLVSQKKRKRPQSED